MKESFKHTHEHGKTHEFETMPEHARPSAEREASHEAAVNKYERERGQALESARQHAEKTARPSESLHVETEEKNVGQGQVNRELKGLALQRVLTRTRKRLSLPEKTISRLIHQPVVDAVSSAAEKTIARPSGFLLGGSVAFLGSLYLLYSSRHYGFRYNFLLVILLFIAGYIIGVVLEILPKFVKQLRAK